MAIELVREGSCGIVRVRDTGSGVDPAEREIIVQRFYRANSSRHTDGIGLGLSLVAAIVKLHGFRFHVADGPGFVAEVAFAASVGWSADLR